MTHDLDAQFLVDPLVDAELTELIYVQHFVHNVAETVTEHLHAIRDRARLGNTTPVSAAMVDELTAAVEEAAQRGSSRIAQALTDAFVCLGVHLDRELARVVVVDASLPEWDGALMSWFWKLVFWPFDWRADYLARVNATLVPRRRRPWWWGRP